MIARKADPDRVRVARPEDEPELIELCRRNHAEHGLGPFAPDKVRTVLHRAFDERANDRCFVGITGTDGIEGSIGLRVDEPWDGDVLFLRGLWNYVLPEYRAQTTHMHDQTAFAQRLSQPEPVGIGIPLWIDVIMHVKTEHQVRIYTRHLGEPAAVTWLCESNH